jgi:radical SAM superfamily enzyme YgiQ (UPF0313 family)
MKISLVFIPQRRKQKRVGLDSQPVQAIYLIGSILTEAGYDVNVIDSFNIDGIDQKDDEQISKRLVMDSDVILFSSNSFNWGTTAKVVQSIRRIYPEILLLAGGIHPSAFAQYVIQNYPIDIVVRGEGEITLLKLLECLEQNGYVGLEKIKGITYRTKKGEIMNNEDLCTLSDEAYNHYNSRSPFDKLPADVYEGIPCETSRGCLYNCIFCGIGLHNKWKTLTIDNAIKKIDSTITTLEKKCAGGFIALTDDCFTTNKVRAARILKHINQHHSNFKLVLEGRLNEIQNEEILKVIDEQRIFRFLVGIECGYNKGLRLVRKGYTIEMIEEYLSYLKQCGISKLLYCSFIIGLPWESEVECIQTIQFAAKIMTKYGVQSKISSWSIIPSELWSNRDEYQIDLDESFFDNPEWFFLSDNAQMIQIIYPKMTLSGYEKIVKLLKIYQARGINLIGN